MNEKALMQVEQKSSSRVPTGDVRHGAVLGVLHTANILAGAGAALFRPHNLTDAQFYVLLALKYTQKPLSQSDLSARLAVTRASVTSVLDKLEKKELVARQRAPGNRRANHVVLTRKGKALVDTLEPAYRALVRRLTGTLSEQNCHTLIEWLEQVRASANGAAAWRAEHSRRATPGETANA